MSGGGATPAVSKAAYRRSKDTAGAQPPHLRPPSRRSGESEVRGPKEVDRWPTSPGAHRRKSGARRKAKDAGHVEDVRQRTGAQLPDAADGAANGERAASLPHRSRS